MSFLCVGGFFVCLQRRLDGGVEKILHPALDPVYLLVLHHGYVWGLFWKRIYFFLKKNNWFLGRILEMVVNKMKTL